MKNDLYTDGSDGMFRLTRAKDGVHFFHKATSLRRLDSNQI